jgi:polygalacturonase
LRTGFGRRGPSTDGIDIDSFSQVLVEHCDISDNDDAICLKTGRGADGLRVNKPTENVRDCIVCDASAGFTIWSEASGGICDVKVERLTVLKPVPRGIHLKSAKTRGGSIYDIVIRGVRMEGVPLPIGVDLNWNRSYTYAHIRTADGSHTALVDSRLVRGLDRSKILCRLCEQSSKRRLGRPLARKCVHPGEFITIRAWPAK